MPRPLPHARAAIDTSAPDVLVLLKRSGRGGVERIALRLAAGWRDAGLGVACAVSPPGRPVAEWREILQLLRVALRAIRDSQPRLLFVPGNAYTIVAVLLKLLLGRACPPIVTKVSNDLTRRDMPATFRPFYRLWLRVQGKVLEEFVALSPAMAAEVSALTGVRTGRVHVLANPVLSRGELIAVTPRLRPAGSGRRFVSVGRLEPQKNFAGLLRAFASGSLSDDTLTIFGEGSERQALERLAAMLGIAERVRSRATNPRSGTSSRNTTPCC